MSQEKNPFESFIKNVQSQISHTVESAQTQISQTVQQLTKQSSGASSTSTTTTTTTSTSSAPAAPPLVIHKPFRPSFVELDDDDDDTPETAHTSRKLVLLVDGTWQAPGTMMDATSLGGVVQTPIIVPSNIVKLSFLFGGSTYPSPPTQKVYYHAGVATETDAEDKEKAELQAMFGNIDDYVLDAYTWLVKTYEKGDEIYGFGFSRGATIMRTLFSFIRYCGLVKHEPGFEEKIKSTFEVYKKRLTPEFEELVAKLQPENLKVVPKFIGVFDTVQALDIPSGYAADKLLNFFGTVSGKILENDFHDFDIGEEVPFAYQALALDECREYFPPTLFENRPAGTREIEGDDGTSKTVELVREQKWFRGTHADIGGGFFEQGLADISLQWMLGNAKKAGLYPIRTLSQFEKAQEVFLMGMSEEMWRKRKEKKIHDSFKEGEETGPYGKKVERDLSTYLESGCSLHDSVYEILKPVPRKLKEYVLEKKAELKERFKPFLGVAISLSNEQHREQSPAQQRGQPVQADPAQAVQEGSQAGGPDPQEAQGPWRNYCHEGSLSSPFKPLNPRSALELYHINQERLMRDYKEAVKCYKMALKFDPGNVGIKRDESLLYCMLQDWNQVSACRKELVQLKPGYKPYWLGLALSLGLENKGELAVKVVEALEMMEDEVPPESTLQQKFETSELILFKADLLSTYAPKSATEFLLDNKSKIVDSQKFSEMLARIFFQSGDYYSARKHFETLLKTNPDCLKYLEGIIDCTLKIEPAETGTSAVKTLLNELSETYPRSQIIKFAVLQHSTTEEFTVLAKQTLKTGFLKGIPSLFKSFKPFYTDPSKPGILLQICHDLLTESHSTTEKFPPTFELWINVYLSHHYLHFSQFTESMEYITNAINHSPTIPELYLQKSKIYAKCVNYKSSLREIEYARRLDLQDRYINTKCVAANFRAGEVVEAEKIKKLFLRAGKDGGVDVLKDVKDMQNQAFLVEYIKSRLDIINSREFTEESIKFVKEVGTAVGVLKKIYQDVYEDQFDFQNYCLRRGTVLALSELVVWMGRVFGGEFAVRFGVLVGEYCEVLERLKGWVEGGKESDVKRSKKVKARMEVAAKEVLNEVGDFYEDVEGVIKFVVEKNPSNEGVLKVAVENCVQRGKFIQALKHLNTLSKLASKSYTPSLFKFLFAITKKSNSPNAFDAKLTPVIISALKSLGSIPSSVVEKVESGISGISGGVDETAVRDEMVKWAWEKVKSDVMVGVECLKVVVESGSVVEWENVVENVNVDEISVVDACKITQMLRLARVDESKLEGLKQKFHEKFPLTDLFEISKE
ncbi:N-alpha-acetyltransferase 16, NatA auxiliary subunit [Nowakowskiella sp. JEL0407]|nr:N-alpha-acetyltransferase 16, NatA auxiliary subunit [Nowakowskiella sp. JEL0407]